MRPTIPKCFENLSFHLSSVHISPTSPFERMEAICIIGYPLNNPNARAYQEWIDGPGAMHRSHMCAHVVAIPNTQKRGIELGLCWC